MSEFAGLRGARILITGGAGMLGSAIAHMALEAGAEVVVLDAMLPLYGGNEANLPSPRLGAATSWPPSVSLRDYYRERRHLYS